MAGIKFDITGDNQNFLSALRGAENGVRSTAKTVESAGGDIESAFNRIKIAASTAFAGFSATQVVKTIAETRGEFQQLEVAFNTMLGSATKGKKMMQQSTMLAATTPFDLKGVAGGAKQLLAYGMSADKVIDTLRRLGDVAAGLSIPLGDIVYLYGTTMAQGRMYTQDLNQFTGRGIPMISELAKQFGVAESQVKDLVEQGKVGFPQVQKVIEDLTNEGGKFGGLMEAQSHTITGQISNIEDSIDMMFNDIGQQNEGIINDVLSLTSTAVDHWQQIAQAIGTVITAYGLYKGTLLATIAIEKSRQKLTYSKELEILENEIAATKSLYTAKGALKNADLAEMVAKKQLTQAQAEEIAQKREELALAKQDANYTQMKEQLDAQTAALEALQPVKQQVINADLQEAVAEGTLTQAQAAEIATKREALAALQQEAEARVANLQAKAQEAQATYDAAVQNQAAASMDLENAQAKVEAAKEALDSALEAGDADAQSAAHTQLKTACDEENAAAERLKAASSDVSTASTEMNTTAEAANSAQNELNAVTKGTNATVTGTKTVAEQANTAATGANTIMMRLNMIQTQAATIVQGLFAAAVNTVRAAWEGLKVAMATNPIGAILTGLTVAISLFMSFADSEDEATDANQRFGDSMTKASANVTSLYAVLESSSATSKVHKDALEQLTQTAQEYGLKLDDEKDKTSQLIEKKQELIGLIKEEAVERQKANDIQSATDSYEKQVEDIKNDIKDSLSDDFSDIQKNQLVNLISDEDIENLKNKLEAMNKATAESVEKTGSWNSRFSTDQITAYNKAVSDLTTKIGIYGEKLGVSKSAIIGAQQAVNKQSYALANNRLEQEKTIQATIDAANATNSAILATDGMTESQRELADRTKLSSQDVETLGTTIDELIKAYNDSNINLNITYTELNSPPAWMKGVADRMSSKQLNNLAAYHQARADRMRQHKQQTGHSLVMSNGHGGYTDERQEQLLAGQYSIQARQKQQKEQEAASNKPKTTKKKTTPKKATGKDDKLQAARDAAEYKETLAEAEKQKQRDAIDLEFDTRQAILDARKDSSQKELDQAKLDFDKQKEEIRRGYEDLKDEKIKKAKQLFNANPKNKKKLFNPASVDTSYTKAEIAENNAKNTANEEEYNRKVTDIRNKQNESERASIQSYLKEYGTYEEKKVALTEEAEDKIKKINENADFTAADKDAQIKSIRAGLQKALNDLDLNQMKLNINWDYIFGDLDNVDLDTLSVVKDQLQQLVDTEKDLSPDQMKALVDAMTQIQNKLDLSTPLKTIKEARSEFKAAKKEFDDAKVKYNTAKDNGDVAGQKSAAATMSKASQKMTKAQNKEKKSFSKTTDVINQYAQALSDAGDVMGGAAGQCLKLASSAITAGLGMAKGINDFKTAASNLEKSVAILAIIEAALQAIQVITQLFGGKEDTTLTDYVSTMDTYINLLKDDISSLNDSMTDAKNSMKDTIAYYEQLVALEKESATAIKSKSQVWLNSGASKGFLGIGSKSSEGVKIVKQMQKDLRSGNDEVRKFYQEGYNSLNEYYKQVYGQYASSVKQFGRLDWIWRLSDEDLLKLSKDTKALALLGDNLSQAIVDYASKLKDMQDDQAKEFESLLSVSFDDFYDDYVDLISDLDNTNADFANNFAEYMRKALIKNLVASQYKDKIKKLYDQAREWAKTDEGLTQERINELRKQYVDLAKQAQEDVKTIDSITGYNSAYSQDASSGAWQSMSQETGDELNGRFTALQESNERISESVLAGLTVINSMLAISTSTNGAVLEIRNLMITSNSYMEDMVKYTRKSYNEWTSKLDSIVNNTKNL